MQIKQTSDGLYVAVTYSPTKQRFRTTLTKTFAPTEASSVDNLHQARKYKSEESLARALRKFKAKL
jgi:hypothetical protein